MKSVGLFNLEALYFWSCFVVLAGCANETTSGPPAIVDEMDVGNFVSPSSSDGVQADFPTPDAPSSSIDGFHKPEVEHNLSDLDIPIDPTDGLDGTTTEVPDVIVLGPSDSETVPSDMSDLSTPSPDTDSVDDVYADTSTDTGENEDIVDLPPIKGPLCQDQCTTGTKVCTGTTTYLHCGSAPEGCKKMLPGKCNPNAQCIDGECYCAPTGKLTCPTWGHLYEETVCGTTGEYAKACPYPGCYIDECVVQPAVSYITPWPSGATFWSVSVLKDGYVAVGWDSGIVHQTPNGLVNRSIESWTATFDTVLAYAQDDVYAMARSELFHFDGSSWKLTTAAEAPPIVVKNAGTEMSWMAHGQAAMWGIESPLFYSAGGFGTIYSYDGQQFKWFPNPHLGKKDVSYRSIWGSSDTDIYAVGEAGAAVHYDGKSWKPIPQFDASVGGLGGTFRGVHGRSKDDVFLLREKEIWHFDGATWSQFPDPPSGPVYYSNVFAPAKGGLYVTAGVTFTYAYHDGTKWFEPVKLDVPYYVRAIGGSDYGVVLVGDHGLIVELDGADHTIITQHRANNWPVDRIHDIWGFDDDTVFAAGDYGTVIRKNPDGAITQWDTPELLPDFVAPPFFNYYSSTPEYLTRPWNTIWGSSPTNMYVGGYGIVRRFDGENWTTLDLPGFFPDTLVFAIYGTGPNDVYVSGKLHYYGPNTQGYLAHFDGTTWKEIPNMPPLACLWALNPETWYGVGWAPAALFTFGLQGVITEYEEFWFPGNRCHIAGLPSGEVMYGWGCSNCVTDNIQNLRFLDANGNYFILAAYSIPPPGLFDLVATPNNSFAMIWGTSGVVMNLDVQLLYDGIDITPPGTVVPSSYKQVAKPVLNIPGARSALWWSPKGKIYMGGNANQLFSAQ